MSDAQAPMIELITWRGDVSQLAARFRVSETVLLRQLKALSKNRKGSRLVVMASPANIGPVLSALARRLNEGDAP